MNSQRELKIVMRIIGSIFLVLGGINIIQNVIKYASNQPVNAENFKSGNPMLDWMAPLKAATMNQERAEIRKIAVNDAKNGLILIAIALSIFIFSPKIVKGISSHSTSATSLDNNSPINFCANCGTELTSDDKFCPNCGNKTEKIM